MLFALFLSCLLPSDPPEDLGDCRSGDGDPTTIEDARIEDQTLLLDVAYGGGCEAHEFVLCWPDQSFMESEPVQVQLELYHDANGDSCEAWLSETLELDLAPLAQAWRDSYGGEGGQMTVHVDGFSLDFVF